MSGVSNSHEWDYVAVTFGGDKISCVGFTQVGDK